MSLVDLEEALLYLSSLRKDLKSTLCRMQQTSSRSEVDLSTPISKCIVTIQLADDRISRLKHAHSFWKEVSDGCLEPVPSDVSAIDEHDMLQTIKNLPTDTVLVEEVLTRLNERLRLLRESRIKTRSSTRKALQKELEENFNAATLAELKRVQELQDQFVVNRSVRALLEADAVLNSLEVKKGSEIDDFESSLRTKQTGGKCSE